MLGFVWETVVSSNNLATGNYFDAPFFASKHNTTSINSGKLQMNLVFCPHKQLILCDTGVANSVGMKSDSGHSGWSRHSSGVEIYEKRAINCFSRSI